MWGAVSAVTGTSCAGALAHEVRSGCLVILVVLPFVACKTAALLRVDRGGGKYYVEGSTHNGEKGTNSPTATPRKAGAPTDSSTHSPGGKAAGRASAAS